MKASSKSKTRAAGSDPLSSAPKGAVKSGLSMNHNKSVARSSAAKKDAITGGPKGAVKSGLNFNHNKSITTTGKAKLAGKK